MRQGRGGQLQVVPWSGASSLRGADLVCELLTHFLQNSVPPVLAKKPLAGQAHKPEGVALTCLLKHEFAWVLLIHSGADGKRSKQRRASAVAVWCGSRTAQLSCPPKFLSWASWAPGSFWLLDPPHRSLPPSHLQMFAQAQDQTSWVQQPSRR